MKKVFAFLLVLLVSFAFSQDGLFVYKKQNNEIDESAPVGQLYKSDWLKELPIPKEKVKKVSWKKEKVQVKDKKGRVVKDKKGKPKMKVKKTKVVTWVEQDPVEPPRFVPVDCKFGAVWVKRSDLARFQQDSKDLSGVYASSTGSVTLKKSPTNPRYFSILIQNGPENGRAEIEMGNVEIRESNGHARFTYQEDGCTVDIAVTNFQVKVVQRGCAEYNVGDYKLEGDYKVYKGNVRKVDTFNMPEQQFKYKKYLWCGSGFDSCEKVKDDNGPVFITWSKGGNGFIERVAGEDVHTYRPFEHVIPHKRDYYEGEKPIVIKTKRTDMSGEWMLWYFYPKAERFKMMRAGMKEETAYMEIYE